VRKTKFAHENIDLVAKPNLTRDLKILLKKTTGLDLKAV